MMIRLSFLGIAAALAIAGCGGSQAGGAATVNAAQTSKYSCPLEEVLGAAEKSVKAQFQKVASKDVAQAVVIGEPHWYSADGALRGDAKIQPQKGDIAMAARVRAVDLKPNFKIEIDAYVREYVGVPEPRDIPEDKRPAWVQEHLDKLAVDIHQELDSCSVLVREPR